LCGLFCARSTRDPKPAMRGLSTLDDTMRKPKELLELILLANDLYDLFDMLVNFFSKYF
jgi:hypothetical protein